MKTPLKGAPNNWKNGGRTTKFCTNQHFVENVSGAFYDTLKLCETISFKITVFTNENQQSLSKAMKLQSFDYRQSGSMEVR